MPYKAQFEISSLDSRLFFSMCSAPLSAKAANAALKPGNNVVEIRCDGDAPWKVYVPVAITAQGPVVITKRTIRHKEIIEADDIKVVTRDITAMPAYYVTDVKRVIGMQVKRAIAAGHSISAMSLEAPDLVLRGQTLQVEGRTKSGIMIITEATALGNGKQGDIVKARNRSSRRIIEGVVISAQRIRVNL